MVLKRHFGEEGSDQSGQSPPPKLQKFFQHVINENSLQEIASKIAIILEPTLRRVVKEEVQAALFHSSPRLSLVQQPEPVPARGYQLLIINKLPRTLFTNSRVEAEEHAPLQVQLVDALTKNVIRNCPLSSVKVEIVALSGEFDVNERENWSESEFNESIVPAREGKRPLLIGDLSFALDNGVGFIKNVSFTDNSSWIRSRKFKLGVRALPSSSSGSGIREAVSDSFVVLDHRGESYQKHNTPSVDDPVWRLRKISKQGASHKKLESLGIKTVKDFLMHYHLNPMNLRRMLGKGVANRAWDTMVSHANECHLDNSTYYRYYGEAESAQLLFNSVYKAVAVKFTGYNYQTVDCLDASQKALVEQLKMSAFMNLAELVPVHNSSAISSIEIPKLQHTIQHTSSPQLDLQPDGFSMIHQDEPEKQLDFNLSDSGSYPCTIEDGYVPEDDSTSQTDQPVQAFSQAAFMMSNTSVAPSDNGYNWFLDNPATTFAHNSLFGEHSYANPMSLYPLAGTWGQEDGLLTTSYPLFQNGVPFQPPSFGTSRTPKARWCKIRAAVMWKIVRRNAAAKRRGTFPFGFY